jgi:hypothetical protein
MVFFLWCKMDEILWEVRELSDVLLGNDGEPTYEVELGELDALDEEYVDSTELTKLERERLAREESFELRIARMKEELATRLPDVERKGTEAYSLHPDVHNLPHHVIADQYDNLPDVEITE